MAFAQGDVENLLRRAIDLYRNGEVDEALALANEVVSKAPMDPTAYFIRASVYESKQQYDLALADYNRVVKVSPEQPLVYNRRGALYFKLGRFDDSIADFDREIELDPRRKLNHWQRGLSYYYAGRYEDGANQFELAFKTENPNDYENGIWHFLCRARLDGVDKARESILDIEGDERVPMREIYDLYRGRGTADDVMQAAERGYPNAAELNNRLFYALLYVALFDDVSGNTETALRLTERAVSNFQVTHYMWDVARVHLETLKTRAGKQQ
ncbi:MAG: tetratricopeptide repeat protein [Bryobacterales bacterium]|nr:tetratricopeptide repeat protein [Bryobacterales bacterium]MDE0434296.1 tetratricopeptide repeat protein [Bryobacterales bacterium]